MSGGFVLYADGASRGNPGRAAIGAVLYDPSGATAAEISEYIGEATNNVAEYRAVIAGLEAALAVGAEHIRVRLDSQLLVRQMEGEYRVRAPGLKPLYRRAVALAEEFTAFSVEHVPRERNTVADGLANAALDA